MSNSEEKKEILKEFPNLSIAEIIKDLVNRLERAEEDLELYKSLYKDTKSQLDRIIDRIQSFQTYSSFLDPKYMDLSGLCNPVYIPVSDGKNSKVPVKRIKCDIDFNAVYGVHFIVQHDPDRIEYYISDMAFATMPAEEIASYVAKRIVQKIKDYKLNKIKKEIREREGN